MPTVALYVPAHLFRRLGEDVARVRGVALDALVAAADDDGLAAGGAAKMTGQDAPVPGTVLKASGVGATETGLHELPPAASPSLPVSVREFRPDPKKGGK